MSVAQELFAGLDLLPDAVVVVDREGSVAYCNRMAYRLLGAGPDDLVGRPAAEVLPLNDEAGVDWWANARPLAVDARLLSRIAETDLLCRTAQGRLRPVVVTGSRQVDAEGRLETLVLVFRRGERRRRLDATRSELVSTVSHELRSPLTSVKGFTKTLLAKWDRFSDAQKRQMLETVNEDTDRVTRLLGELLDVSRIDAGRLQLGRRMVDMRQVLEDVLDRSAAFAVEGHRVVADVPDMPQLYVDPDKISQVFQNLIENGLKYSSGIVTVSAVVEEQAVRFTVADQGEGIEPDHRKHIFMKFFRRPGEGRTGTGLGLYISKGIVEAHGGRIWVDSRSGAGACFHFTLPLGGLELAGVPIEMATIRPSPSTEAPSPSKTQEAEET